jgi:alkylresorcinol/alkylpyrone synthase
LVFHAKKPTPAELVGSAIFADGAACAVLRPGSSGLALISHQSFLIPQTRELMGYNLLDDGFHLRLERSLPKRLSDSAPQRVIEFLAEHDLNSRDINHWLFHPGGIKILDLLESSLGIEREQARWSREVLSSVGNLSSSTVLFVLNRYLAEAHATKGDHAVMIGIGPGLTLELILFRWI